MNENKHEQRVRQRAQEIVSITHPITFSKIYISQYAKKAYQEAINKAIPVARLSVQREAEAAEHALEFFHQSIYSSELGKKHCARYLQSLGLVPENEPDQEAGKV